MFGIALHPPIQLAVSLCRSGQPISNRPTLSSQRSEDCDQCRANLGANFQNVMLLGTLLPLVIEGYESALRSIDQQAGYIVRDVGENDHLPHPSLSGVTVGPTQLTTKSGKWRTLSRTLSAPSLTGTALKTTRTALSVCLYVWTKDKLSDTAQSIWGSNPHAR